MNESALDGDPRPAWDVIEETCAARFTGELTLTTAESTTNVYMTRGLIYLAERADDVPLGERLVRAGAMPREIVGNDDPIARSLDLDILFIGRPVEAREAVESAIQAEAEMTLMRVSEQPVLSTGSTMYRHHPSGVDRWFSSQHARGAAGDSTCSTAVVVDDLGPIPLQPEPELIPPLESPDAVDDDVASAVERALSAIESATRTAGPVPKGFVRSRPTG